MTNITYPTSAQRWGVFEISLQGPADGNPFRDQWLSARFTHACETKTVSGFYDGDGVYRLRFMPSFEGEYSFTLQSSFAATQEGHFTAAPAEADNHGPVRVHGHHFEYEDGRPYYPVGTTAYVWTWQSDELVAQTLDTLAQGHFNKIRMCVMPKHYLHNLHEPVTYPFEGTPGLLQDPTMDSPEEILALGILPGNDWDFTRPNPAHFRRFEQQVEALCRLGIQADVILFHGYDRWGFSKMSAEDNDAYLRYTAARLSAYRNVWWAMANEYDLLRHLTVADWERMAAVICQSDPYGHLRSIHNCFSHYDHSRPWITHCSIQREDLYKCAELTDQFRTRYNKPVVLDELGYEGDIDQGWGNLTGQELLRRFWEATCRGGYASHGETFLGHGSLFWAHGGALHGESHERIKFLHDEVLEKIPGHGLKRVELTWDETAATVDTQVPSGYYLIYYGFFRPSYRRFYFDDTTPYRAEVIDTWNMTVTDMGVHSGHFRIPLPGRQYMAIRLTAVK